MDRVVIEPYIVCNRCAECPEGDFERCTDLQYMGQNSEGLFKNFVDVSINQAHRLPDNLTNEQALFVSYIAFCLNIVDSIKMDKGGHVAIFASTKTGIILAQLVLYYQGVPILVSNNEDLLESARELGIFYCLNSTQLDIEEEILTITGGRMCREVVLFSDSEFSVRMCTMPPPKRNNLSCRRIKQGQQIFSFADKSKAPHHFRCVQRRGQLFFGNQFACYRHRQGGQTYRRDAQLQHSRTNSWQR